MSEKLLFVCFSRCLFFWEEAAVATAEEAAAGEASLEEAPVSRRQHFRFSGRTVLERGYVRKPEERLGGMVSAT